MKSKLLVGCITALLLIFVVIPASAQAIYAAREDHPRLSVGAGFSGFNQDWGGSTLVYGDTLWVDYRPPFIPGFLNGLGLELEARDLHFNRGTYPSNYPVLGGEPGLPRTDTLGGGLIYHVERFKFHKIVPYAKGLVSYGSIDFTIHSPKYSHDTRTVYALGGGIDYRLTHRISIRGDYEYQWWPEFLGHNSLNPGGFTVGALYSFGH